MLPGDLQEIVRRALSEDIGSGDITTLSVVPGSALGQGRVVAREALVACGLGVMVEVFRQVDSTVEVSPLVEEGEAVGLGTELATIKGPLGAVLTGERVALNFAQRMSGIATHVRTYHQALQGAQVRLVDTRKTTPGIRSLEKFAVRTGGGESHRSGLFDGVMIKDNHIVAAGGITKAVKAAFAQSHHLLAIQVEVTNLAEADEAVDAGARVLLLDNFGIAELREAVGHLRKRGESLTLEASGGIQLGTIAEVAATGVDVISSGALIHQARWVDIALDLE